MRIFRFIAIVLLLAAPEMRAQKSDIPFLKKEGNHFQLMVNNKPVFILGGELGNSSAADTAEMNAMWPHLREMGLNTVLVPVYWELMEPVEGHFDFTLIDAMIDGARESKLKLVLLWFGTWKNSMSCYAPEWAKLDDRRFPRTLDSNGKPAEIISAFSENILRSDIKAFETLMSHLKAIDATEHTVLMVQVENETGQLPHARDYSALANKAFNANVPEKLINYLNRNKNVLLPYVKNLWAKNGYKTSGNWETVFGKSLATDELFTAWYYAAFINRVTEAGKAVYNLPMYVNCALNRPGVDPGKYPSGGPLPHLIDIWKAAAPAVDMLSPDIYHGDFRSWCAQYDRPDNPVFVPEIKQEKNNAVQVFYVAGKHKAIGFCPFAIELASDEEAEPLCRSYKLLDNLWELLAANRDKTNGAYLDKLTQTDTISMGNYQIVVAHVCTLPWTDGAKAETWTPAGCVIIQTAPDEFWIGGTSVVCTFRNTKSEERTTGLLSVDLCSKTEKGWYFKRLNGDQTHQGRHMRMGSGSWEIQRVRLYGYK
jgi:hypothetical protein